MLRKLTLLLFPVLMSSTLTAQVVTRAYLNTNLGLPVYGETGFAVHFLKHISMAGYWSDQIRGTGFTYIAPGGFLGGGKKTQLRNEYYTYYLLAGIGSRTFKKLNCSLMAGPAWVSTSECRNMHITESYQSYQEIDYDLVHRHAVGGTIRGDVTLALGRCFGFTAGVMYTKTHVNEQWNVHIGAILGIVKDASDIAWKPKKIRDQQLNHQP